MTTWINNDLVHCLFIRGINVFEAPSLFGSLELHEN